MPTEGHGRRAHTPLRKLTARERGVLYVGAAAVVVAVVLLVVLPGGGGGTAPQPGCIRVVVAGRVGGEPVHACGAQARAVCALSARFDVPRSRTILDACREQGIPVPGGAAASGQP